MVVNRGEGSVCPQPGYGVVMVAVTDANEAPEFDSD